MQLWLSLNWRRNILNKYKVRLYRRALRDLDSIYAYIAFDKASPAAAKSQTDRIKNAILVLAYMPYAHQDRLVGQYAGKGYKQLVTDNYITVFRIDEENKTVWVITVQYGGRDT